MDSAPLPQPLLANDRRLIRQGRLRSWRWALYFLLMWLPLIFLNDQVLLFYGVTPSNPYDLTDFNAIDVFLWLTLFLSQATLGFTLSEVGWRRERDRRQAREQRFHMLGRIAASMAHEMRNPLHNLHLLVERIRDHDGQADPASLGRIEENLERIDHAILLAHELARPALADGGGVARIDQIVALAVAELAQRHPHARLLLNESGPLLANCRSTALRMAIENLLRNAIDAAGQAEITASSAAGEVRITIRNPGQLPAARDEDGVPTEATTSGGFGIGLSIARHLVTACGGRLRLDDADGVVTATITLRTALEDA